MPIVPPEIAETSPRTRTVFDLMLRGHPEKEIASKLGLSPHTVHAHIKRIYKIMGVNTRPQMQAEMLNRLIARVATLEGLVAEAGIGSPADAREIAISEQAGRETLEAEVK